jgi:hypothetical protein
MTGWSAASVRNHQRVVIAQIAIATHSAQAMCRDGTAA